MQLVSASCWFLVRIFREPGIRHSLDGFNFFQASERVCWYEENKRKKNNATSQKDTWKLNDAITKSTNPRRQSKCRFPSTSMSRPILASKFSSTRITYTEDASPAISPLSIQPHIYARCPHLGCDHVVLSPWSNATFPSPLPRRAVHCLVVSQHSEPLHWSCPTKKNISWKV